jgi:hypothetical protein
MKHLLTVFMVGDPGHCAKFWPWPGGEGGRWQSRSLPRHGRPVATSVAARNKRAASQPLQASHRYCADICMAVTWRWGRSLPRHGRPVAASVAARNKRLTPQPLQVSHRYCADIWPWPGGEGGHSLVMAALLRHLWQRETKESPLNRYR